MTLCVTSQFIRQCFALLVRTGLFVSVENSVTSSLVGRISKEYFHALLLNFKSKFHAQNQSLKGKFEVMVCEYAQIMGLWESCKKNVDD